MRRRLQDSVLISPSGGCISAHSNNGLIPSISVSVQTDPLLNGNGVNGHVPGMTSLITSNGNGHLGNGGGHNREGHNGKEHWH